MEEVGITQAIQIADKNCQLSLIDGRWRIQYNSFAKLNSNLDDLQLEAFFENQAVAERQVNFMKMMTACYVLDIEHSAEEMIEALNKFSTWEAALQDLTIPY